MITASLTGLSCAIIEFLLPFTTAVALANATPQSAKEERAFNNAAAVWTATLVVSFFAVAGLDWRPVSTLEIGQWVIVPRNQRDTDGIVVRRCS